MKESISLGNKIKGRIIRKQELLQNYLGTATRKNKHRTTSELYHPISSNQNLESAYDINKQKSQLLKQFKLPQNFSQYFKPEVKDYYHHIHQDRISSFYSKSINNLDTRDERIIIPIISKYFAELQKSKFQLSLQPLKDEIRDWLIDVVEIITSISFNHLKCSNLTQNETKNFAAKNIMFNIKQFFLKQQNIPFDKRFQLMKYINQEINDIFEAIMIKYPQTSSKGASKRIKNKILKINIRDSDQYDFLYTNNIRIKFNESGDYSEDIMKIINRLISISSDVYHPNDQTEETNYQVFTQIIEHIYNYSGLQDVSQTVEQIVQLLNRKKQSKLNRTNSLNTFQNLQFSSHLQRKSSIQKIPTDKYYLIGQKIPSDTKLFTKEEIQGSNFKINNSSILRILTKWAQELRHKLQNAQEIISKRLYKFKTNSGHFINLELEKKDLMTQYALKEENQIKDYLDYLKLQNIFLQSYLIQEPFFAKSSKHGVKVDVFSAKLREISSQYTFNYLNKLIHSLMLVPQRASQNSCNYTDKALLGEIDLITLKIGDLMRSKCACSQQQFLKILATLQKMSNEHPEIIRLLRIKNRLDLKDNDILINIFFLNKLQCEIQLSIKAKQNATQKAYSSFCHFIYEIIRAEFGPLSQMANIICQYDPLANHYSKRQNFGPQLLKDYTYQAKRKYITQNLFQILIFKKTRNLWRYDNLPFICSKCMELSIIHNPKLIYKDPSDPKLYCNLCKKLFMTEEIKKKAYAYIHDFTFSNFQSKNFFVKHIQAWSNENFIDKIKMGDQDICYIEDLPTCGMYLKANQKLPKLKVFNTAYQQISKMLMFGQKTKNGKFMIFLKIPIYSQKNKRLKVFSEQLSKVKLFRFIKVKKAIKQNKIFLICSDDTCNCNKEEMYIGQYFSSDQIIQHQRDMFIENTLLNTLNIWNFHGIPLVFDKVQSYLRRLQDGKKIKIYKYLQIIFAYNCGLRHIKTISKFPNLLDLQINDNPQLKSLSGLQKCYKLKNLDCRNCGLQNLNEISQLKNIQYLNISNNNKIICIEELSNFTELKQIFMAHTGVKNVDGLKNARHLQYLDLQGCTNLNCLNEIKSEKMIFINIIDCYHLKSFNISKQAYKSLKKINYSKQKNQQEKITSIFGFVINSKKVVVTNLDQTEEQIQESNLKTEELIEQINLFLKQQYQDHNGKDEPNPFQEKKNHQFV